MALTTPPFRTSLLTANGVPFATDNGDIQTTRDWWMYWNQLTDRSNANSKLTSEGAHADRPDPGSMPDGAIYIEADRGTIYSNEGGAWQYVAGTMYGTLSPDERPADLGTHDAGFDFRGTDQPREFLWSQTAWIEVTAVQYGTHANRPDPTTIVEGALYVESDRGGVIYQRETPVTTPLWQYLAGTMWGTLSPDQRPTDLGPHDAGFDFRTTTSPPREFVWNQTAWVETTPVGGAVNLTHPNVVTRVDAAAGAIVEGGITDLSAANSNSVYVSSTGQLGIGTTSSPFSRLHVRSGSSGLSGALNADTVAVLENSSNAYLEVAAGAGKAAVLILEANGTANACQIFDGWDGTNHNLGVWGLLGNGYLTFGTVASERMRITQAGNVGIGTPGPTFLLQLSADSAAKPATSTWSVVSDLRLKQNVEPVKDDSLAILNKLDWIRYEYNGKAQTPENLKGIGLVAQELRYQLPEAVRSTRARLDATDADETDVLAIDYHHILAHSARAIQQLSAEVQSLKALIGKPPA